MKEKSLRLKCAARAVLFVLLLTVVGLNKSSAHDFEVDNLLYSILSTNPPTVSLDGHIDGTAASDELLIPETVEYDNVMYTVVAIGDHAFAEYTDMYGDIEIPNTVVTIGNHAFDNTGFDGSLMIGESVTSIGNCAFANLLNTGGDLTIPNSVTHIGDSAFFQSYFDGTLTLSNHIVSIGAYAFYHGDGSLNNSNPLTVSQLNLPSTLTSIGAYAFYNCWNMTGRLTLSTALTSIGAYAFCHCGFTQLNFGSTTGSHLQTIGDHAFYYCQNMAGNLNFPTSLQHVGDHAFYNCGFNGTLNLRNVQTIGDYAFCECRFYQSGSNKHFTIPNSVTEIGNGAFCEAFSAGTDLTINAALVAIPNSAFAYNHFVGSLTIPSSVVSIGSYAFENNNFTGDLTIHEAVETIGYNAFYGCSELTNVYYNAVNCAILGSEWDNYGWLNGCSSLLALYIGENVQSISDHAFEIDLPAITVFAQTPPTLGESVFANTSTTPVYVPCDYEEAYTSINWGGFSNLFGLCSGTVTIMANPTGAGSVTGAGYYEAGTNCTVTATANAGYAFANWTRNGMIVSRDAEYTFPIAGDMTMVANFVQEGNIVFADANVKSICVENWDTNSDGELSYVEAAAVTSLSDEYGNSYFQYNSDITSFDELQYFIGLTTIGNNAFAYCENLASIEFPSSITTIGEYAFHNCSGLMGSITIGENVTNIGHYAFARCQNITTLNYNAINSNASNAYNDYGWLEYCNSLHTLNIGEQVQMIPDNAFYGFNVNFTGELVIPASVISIGENAFRNNNFSTIICMAGTPPTMGEYVFFEDDPLLIPVYVPCEAVEDYESVSWGGFSNFNGLCGGIVTVVASPTEGGVVTGGGYYEAGTNCTVTATANAGYAFANWTRNGMIVSRDAEYTFPIAGDMTLVANFVQEGNIIFADANVKSICVEHWDTNSDGELSYVEAASVTTLSNEWEASYFRYNSEITSFDELQYFIGLSVIENSAFKDCSNLTSVVLSNSVTIIGEEAFRSTGLTSIVLPSALTTLKREAFRYCNNLSGNLVIPNTVTTIEREVFRGCSSLVGELTIPAATTSIGYGAFQNTSFTVLNYNAVNCSINTDGDHWLQGCSNLATLNIGADVQVIPADAFNREYDYYYGYGSFTGELTIPSSVTSIGDRAFPNNSFTSLNVLATMPPTLGENVFFEYEPLDIPVYVPCDAVEAYENVPWGGFNTFYGLCGGAVAVAANPTEAGTVTGGGTYTAGQNCTVTATSNAGYAFVNWTKNGVIVSTNAEYTFPVAFDAALVANFVQEGNIVFADANVKSICVENWDTNSDGELSYVEAAAVTSLSDEYGNSYFQDNSDITSFDELQYFIGLTAIGERAFNACSSLVSIELPAALTAIGERAFNACSSLVSIELPAALTSIGDEAFQYCSSLVSIELPAALTAIGERAFRYCGLTGELTIPSSMTSIGSRAFLDNSFTSLIVLADTPPTMGENVFFEYEPLDIPVYVPCDAVEAYENVPWGGFNTFYGLCGGAVAVAANPTEAGTVTGGGTYTAGQNCTVTATSNAGYAFVNWTKNGVIVSTNAEYTFPVAFDAALVANFVPDGNIVFADANVKSICVAHWDINGDGELSYYEASLVTDLSGYFIYNSEISSFDELQYFLQLESIGNYTFLDCSGLESITLPSAITTIGYNVFYGCSSLSSLTILAETPPALGGGIYLNWNELVYVPCNATEAYENISWGGLTSFIGLCGGTVTVVASSADGGVVAGGGAYGANQSCTVTATACAGYVFVSWTKNGRKVSSNAIYTFSVPYDVTLVANYVPAGNIVFADGNVKSICVTKWDTNGDGELSYVEAAAVTSLTDYRGNSYFYNNSEITSFNELQYFIGLTWIEDRAFYRCSNLSSVKLPENITWIGEQSFAQCGALAGNLIIPNYVTIVDNNAYEECSNLSGVLLSKALATIGESAFRNCSNLQTITVLAEDIPEVGNYAFEGVGTTIPVYVPCVSYDDYVAANWGGFTNFQCSDCPAPFYLEAKNITHTTADLTWTGISDSYTVQKRTAGYSEQYFFEDFDSGIPETWTTIDNDGDGYNWYSHQTNYAVASRSWQNNTIGALSPDNWLITPAIELQGVLRFNYYENWTDGSAHEHFAVYVSTTAPNTSSFDPSIFTCISGDAPLIASTTVAEFTYDLGAYNHAVGYIAIRHYDCTDVETFLVDNFGVYGIDIPAGEWTNVTTMATNGACTINGLTANTKYDVRVKGNCDGGEYSDAYSFTTLDENTKIFTIAGDWDVASNWSGGIPTLANNAIIRANVTIPSGSIAIAKTVTIEGTPAPTITIKDGGQLVHNNNNVVVTMEKVINGYNGAQDNYYFLAVPTSYNDGVDPSTVPGMLENSYDLYQFNYYYTGEEWQNYENTAFNLYFGNAYLYANSVTTTLAFTGEVSASSDNYWYYGLDFDDDDAYPFDGWNLVGNLFTCNAYMVKMNASDETSFYKIEGDRIIASAGAIAPLEGVFVKTKTANTRVYWNRTAPEFRSGLLNISVNENNNIYDRAIIRFGEGEGLEKFQLNPSHTKLFIPQDNIDYAVVYAEDQGEKPVHFKAEKNGTYTLSFSTENVEFSYLHLIDNMTGTDIDLLATPSYSFDARTIDYASRFKLVFAKGSADKGNDFGFFDANGNLMILGIEGTATLQVIDVTGRMISSETFSGNYSKAINAKAGVYMLRLIQGNNVRTQKIVVR